MRKTLQATLHAIGLGLALALGAGPGAASATVLANIDLDFSCDSLPAGWFVVSAENGGSIRNGRMETISTNQGITISHDLAAPVPRFVIRFRGEIRDSQWGSRNELHLVGDSATVLFHHVNNAYDRGHNNEAQILFSGESSPATPRVAYPERFPTFLHEIEFEGTTATYRVIDEATQTVVADITRSDAPLAAHEVTRIRVRVAHTTNAGPTWIDDVHIELHEPTAACPCWPEGVPLVDPQICYARPGPFANAFIYFTPPSTFLQGNERFCRTYSELTWTSGAESEACHASLQCLCGNPNPGPELWCNGNDDDCNPDTPDQTAEICDDGVDNDCDGGVDGADPDCIDVCLDG